MAEQYRTTSVRISDEALRVLRIAAAHRAQTRGGRLSVSAVIDAFVTYHRAAFLRGEVPEKAK
jgi:hypothetical protein